MIKGYGVGNNPSRHSVAAWVFTFISIEINVEAEKEQVLPNKYAEVPIS